LVVKSPIERPPLTRDHPIDANWFQRKPAAGLWFKRPLPRDSVLALFAAILRWGTIPQ
jgi:hypothetical protein